MPAFTDITGLVGIALALGAIVVALPCVRRLSRARLSGLFFAVRILALVPFGTRQYLLYSTTTRPALLEVVGGTVRVQEHGADPCGLVSESRGVRLSSM